MAPLLSFFVPGLGQLALGQPFNGLFWFIIVVVGYVCFIVPGIILHILCIIGAGMGQVAANRRRDAWVIKTINGTDSNRRRA